MSLDPAFLADRYNYWIVIVLMMTGLYIIVSRHNLIKKVVGIGIFQTSAFMLYISMGKVEGGTAPILIDAPALYANPLPHVLILTAIVVGVATMAVGLALAVRINSAYGSIEEDDILARDRDARTGDSETDR